MDGMGRELTVVKDFFSEMVAQPISNKFVTKQVTLNCFVHINSPACLDNDHCTFIQFHEIKRTDIPVHYDACTFKSCYGVGQEFVKSIEKNSVGDQYAQKRLRRNVQSKPDGSGTPHLPSNDNYRNNLPSAPASIADIQNLESSYAILR